MRPSDLPLEGLFEPFSWAFLVLLGANLVMFASLVVLREQWVLHSRRRARIRARLAPIVEGLLDSDDPEGSAEELGAIVRGLSREERPVAAWLFLI